MSAATLSRPEIRCNTHERPNPEVAVRGQSGLRLVAWALRCYIRAVPDPLALPPAEPILVIGHGSRNPLAKREFMGVVQAYRARAPGVVAHAFLERDTPPVDEALATLLAQHGSAIVAPLLLFAAGHLRRDLPALIRQAMAGRHVEGRVRIARELGTHPQIPALALARLGMSAPALVGAGGAESGIVVLGRGSSEAAALRDFQHAVAQIAAALPKARVRAAHADLARPTLAEALEGLLRDRGLREVWILPFLLFSGALLDRALDTVTHAADADARVQGVCAHLGADTRIVDILEARVREAREHR